MEAEEARGVMLRELRTYTQESMNRFYNAAALYGAAQLLLRKYESVRAVRASPLVDQTRLLMAEPVGDTQKARDLRAGAWLHHVLPGTPGSDELDAVIAELLERNLESALAEITGGLVRAPA